MPIWKFAFGMMAMRMYLGTPLILIVPEGVLVLMDKATDDGHK